MTIRTAQGEKGEGSGEGMGKGMGKGKREEEREEGDNMMSRSILQNKRSLKIVKKKRRKEKHHQEIKFKHSRTF